MNRKLILFSLMCATFALLFSGCARNREDVWDDTRTASRHVGRGVRSLGGKHGDSRQVCSREDFTRCEDYAADAYGDIDYTPLMDAEIAMADRSPRQALKGPGDLNSDVPGINAFYDPSKNPETAGVFKNITFNFDSSVIRGDDNSRVVRNIAAYMKKNPHTLLFIEGHCDEKGAEAYNLALGSRRANIVRDQLIKEGVSPDAVFTVSYGKERPLYSEHTEIAWGKNRRAQFKIYQR